MSDRELRGRSLERPDRAEWGSHPRFWLTIPGVVVFATVERSTALRSFRYRPKDTTSPPLRSEE